MKKNKKPEIVSRFIPVSKEDQHDFYAQFCFELSTISEQNESEVTESFHLKSYKERQITNLIQLKLEELIRINQVNLDSDDSLGQFDEKTNLQVPIQGSPKFIEYITKNY